MWTFKDRNLMKKEQPTHVSFYKYIQYKANGSKYETSKDEFWTTQILYPIPNNLNVFRLKRIIEMYILMWK